jgi:multisubunit Na+/H+ antiporter MnhF subunit
MSSLELIALFLMALALFAGVLRMLIGPTVPDRVVAADILAIITTVALVWIAHKFANPIYLDIALVYGVLAFVSVVVIARVIEG